MDHLLSNLLQLLRIIEQKHECIQQAVKKYRWIGKIT